jgi:hypothetical protein
MSCPLHAWGDESIRTRGLPAPAYLLGASRLTLEARPDALMVRDRRTVDDLRVRGVIPPSMRIEHGRPSEDALLWLPDQALGLVGESIVRGDDHRMALGTWTRVVEIEP